MEIFYNNRRTEKLCTNLKHAIKTLGPEPGKNLLKAINFIELATSFETIMNYAPFHYHKLKGNQKDTCSLDFNGRKSKWRLYVKPTNENGENLISNIENIKSQVIHILIMEVIDHG